jgi:hypothetical protein
MTTNHLKTEAEPTPEMSHALNKPQRIDIVPSINVSLENTILTPCLHLNKTYSELCRMTAVFFSTAINIMANFNWNGGNNSYENYLQTY